MKIMSRFCLLLCILLSLCACGTGRGDSRGENTGQTQNDFNQMVWENGMELSYANQFSVEKSGDFYLITIVGSDRFLVIPEGKSAPEGVPKDVVTLQKPLDHAYVASSSVFDLIRQAGALDHLRLSGTKKEELFIKEAVDAMDQGMLLYAGKYSKPDYELLIGEGCDLAIENTMIYHNPETKEKLESLGIPVLVETSSYEDHPFGRMEWIKLYGLLFDRQEEAERFFEREVSRLEPTLQREGTGLTVAFFYVNSNGAINVRKPGDYVAKMISLAGGEYVPGAIEGQDENALSTMNMELESFYLAAKDADVIVYNSTIVGGLNSTEDLLALNLIFSDFKAVKTGRVYCTEKNFFQETTAIGTFVEDLSRALRDPDASGFHQLKKVPD